MLLNRDLVLDETQVELNLGPYNAEKQVFPEARLGVRDQSVIPAYSWPLYVPLQQAKSFNSAVNNGTVKIRVNVSLDANSKDVKIEKGSIEDLVQEAEFGFPNPSLKVDSTPSGASVLLDGVEFGLTPFAGEVLSGQYEVSVSVEGLKNLPASKSVSLDYGDSQSVSFRLNVKKGDKISNGRLVPKGMVLIPAGSFDMGSGESSDEQPIHTVYIDAFYMDKYEVTNAQYGKFMSATGHRDPGYWDDSDYNQPNQPVVGVSWNDAVAYARWLGKRLPTEAEWEYAARGGLSGKKYPWGDSISTSQANYGRNVGKPVPVGSYPANGYGLYDMAGNVWEWCSDWYDENYYSNSPVNNPQGPSTGEQRVLRGGSGLFNSFTLRVAYRDVDLPSLTTGDCGFRCVSGF